MKHQLELFVMVTGITTMGLLLDTVQDRVRNSQHLATGAPIRRPRRPNSICYYECTITRIRKSWPTLDALTPGDVTDEMVFQWASIFRRCNCPESFNGARDVLRACFAIAIKRRLIEEDPTAELAPAEIPDRQWVLPNAEQWRAAVLAMRAYAQRSRKGRQVTEARRFVEWIAMTGMRPAATRALLVSDVDLMAGTVRLAAEHAKNCKTAFLPIGREAVSLAREAGAGRPPEARLFNTRFPKNTLRVASEAAGVHISLATLRKLFATRALEAGVAPAIAARLLTHSDGGQTLLKHYAQWRDDAMRGAVEKMEAAACSILEKNL